MPPLPDGLVIVVKEECETCRMVVPVLRQLAASVDLTVYTQDDAEFPGDPAAIHDADLAISWHHDVETVPTVIKVEGGRRGRARRSVGRAISGRRSPGSPRSAKDCP